MLLKNAIHLAHRGLLEVKGMEAAQFLQGLLTRDVVRISASGRPSLSYSLLLNVKGRIVSDLLVYSHISAQDGAKRFLIEGASSSMPSLQRIFSIYKLRRQVDVNLVDPTQASVFFSTEAPTSSEANYFVDPRASQFGYRFIRGLEAGAECRTAEEDYVERRMEWGIPEGSEELGGELPLNSNGDWMNGIDFEKGCYIGQELVARTYHTGVIRRRIMPFRLLTPPVSDHLVPRGTAIVDVEGTEQGKIIRLHRSRGLALVKMAKLISKKEDEKPLLIKLTDKNLLAGKIEIYKPDWWPSDWVR